MADESTDAVPCVANPDVAGIGILFSLVASAMLTFFISLACALLKHFSPPLDAAALDQELLHRMDRTPSGLVIYSLLALGFKGRPVLFSKNPGNAVYMWHYISSELALSLGFNQIITGLALLICTLAKYNISSRDPHVSLARTLSLLSVASQALVGFNVQISQGTTSGIRGWLSVLYIYTFIIVNAIGFKKTHDVANLIGAVLLGFVISWPGLFDLVALMKEGSNSDSDEVPSRRTTRNRNFAFASSLIVEAVFVTYYTVRVFQLKYDSDTTGGCDLNTAEVNQWTLGQILALIMLVAPFLSARETYRNFLGERMEAHRQRSRDSYANTLARLSTTAADASATSFQDDSLTSQDVNAQAATSSADVVAADSIGSPPSRRTTTRMESQS